MSDTSTPGKLGVDLGIGINTPIEVIVRAVADIIITDRTTMDPLNRFKVDSMRVVFLELLVRIIAAPAVAAKTMAELPVDWMQQLTTAWLAECERVKSDAPET